METLTLLSPHFRRFSSPFPLLSLIRRSMSIKSHLTTRKLTPMSSLWQERRALLWDLLRERRKQRRVWKNIIQKGNTVIDATCGNGYDTLALLTMVSDESYNGGVFGMDIQQEALDNTSSLLEISVEENRRKLVKLFKLCHSKLEDIIQEPVRLVAFNLGYLPGGDKTILTSPRTTVAALHAACRVLQSGGLISVMVYIGHPGGRDELEAVQGFASDLPVEAWTSTQFEMLNRPAAPVLVLIFKK